MIKFCITRTWYPDEPRGTVLNVDPIQKNNSIMPTWQDKAKAVHKALTRRTETHYSSCWNTVQAGQ